MSFVSLGVVRVLSVSFVSPRCRSYANAASGYVKHTVDLSAYAGKTVTLTFSGTEDYSLQSSFVLDDVTATLS